VDELKDRRIRDDLPVASSFRDQAEAERLIESALRRRTTTIDEWLASARGRITLEVPTDTAAGISVTAEGPVVATRLRLVLARDPSMPEGFRIYTAYPHP
jgi:hypothetical protein